MNKKAITLQFHWIFILIAGGLILVFFFSVANKQKDLSEDKLSFSLIQGIDMILEMAESSEGTSQTIPLPKKGISTTCSKMCDCYFTTGRARSSFGNNIIFSEQIIDSPEAIIWSLPWKVPFRVVNILYMTNPETRKIFVFDDSNFAKDLKKKLIDIIPDNIFFEVIDFNNYDSLSYDGSPSTRIFLIGTPKSNIDLPEKLKDKNTVLTEINSNFINFYKKDTAVRVKALTYPFDITWILAAMFSADENMFVCGLKSALNRLNHVANVFYKRSVALQEDTDDLGMRCSYSSEMIKGLVEQTKNAESVPDNDLFDIILYINSVKDTLKTQNDQLIKNSCPELF